MLSVAALVSFLRSDVVAIGGGGLFGNEMQPLPQLLPLVGVVAAAIGKDVIFVVIGVYTSAPLWVQRTLRRVAARSRFVSVRDRESAAVLDSAAEVVLVADPGITLVPLGRAEADAALVDAGVDITVPLLGVSLKSTRYAAGNERQVSAAVAAIDAWHLSTLGMAVIFCLSERGTTAWRRHGVAPRSPRR
jgi:hypothetical protein